MPPVKDKRTGGKGAVAGFNSAPMSETGGFKQVQLNKNEVDTPGEGLGDEERARKKKEKKKKQKVEEKEEEDEFSGSEER